MVALNKIQQRLDVFETLLINIHTNIERSSFSQGSLTFTHSPPSDLAYHVSPGSYSGVGLKPVSHSSPAFSVHSCERERRQGCRMPSLITFSCPPLFGRFSYDSSTDFFAGAVNGAHHAFPPGSQTPDSCLVSLDDSSPQLIWRVQQQFADGFLRWFPLFDEDTCLRYVSSDVIEGSLACMRQCIFAIGIASGDQVSYSKDAAHIPGLAFHDAAQQLLDVETGMVPSLLYVQSRVILA
jgi:hypothetical protein